MKVLLALAFLVCTAVWSSLVPAESRVDAAELVAAPATEVLAATTATDSSESKAAAAERRAEVQAAPIAAPTVGPPEPLVIPPGSASLSVAEIESLARQAFRAQVKAEELVRALPADLPEEERTREHFPELFEAADERDRLLAELGQVPPPAASEPLPTLELSTGEQVLERIYRSWSREELLIENWRISRAAWAESQRELDWRLTHGPYEATPMQNPTWG